MDSRVPTSSPLSSALSSEATFHFASSQPRPQYRSAQPLPFELQQHIQIYLEEKLFSQAFKFLLGLISATAANDKKKVPIPPPDYLAVISTICLHPHFTSKTSEQDKWNQSNAALRLLWTVQKIVGPINANLTNAYRFRKYDDQSRPRRGDDDVDEMANQKLLLTYAESDCLFSLAEDFWSIVGWVLNCSCLPGAYTTRWSYSQQWLEYMLDVLRVDWDMNDKLCTQSKSLLWQYIRTATGGNVRGRRILRAIFADGSESALREFHEIFRKELKEAKKDKEIKKQEVKVDVDGEIYGDWLQAESSTDEDHDGIAQDQLNPRPTKRVRTRTLATRRQLLPQASRKSMVTDTEDSDASAADDTKSRSLGSPESMSIRIQLLQLLSSVSARHDLVNSRNEPIFPDLHELYTLFVEFIRPLPLPIFQQFILPSTSSADAELSPEARTALCEFMLQRTVDSDTNSRHSTFESMTQERLAKEYLPFPGAKNTIEAQVKVSLLLESLVRMLANSDKGVLRQDDTLAEAVEEGIETRRAKANELRDGGRRKGTHARDEEYAAQVLEESSMRIRFVVSNLSG